MILSCLKKLFGDIWEFRTRFKSKQIRLLAFWDKRGSKGTLVIATHGFVKKTQKTPNREIERAIELRRDYLKKK
jgi:phage-related protein